MVEKITNQDLELYAEKVSNDVKYGGEGELISEALKHYPKNDDISIVAMKICLIDNTNGTNLSRNLGKQGGLYKLSEKIANCNFDNRVKNGDLTLIRELSEWTKQEFGKNLFSFVSKYCLYHNFYCYERDDFAIFDSVVSQNIYKYISKEDYKEITGNKLSKYSTYNLRNTFDYELYIRIINFILKSNNITTQFPHRKLDWFIWYKNR